jgi:Ion channel
MDSRTLRRHFVVGLFTGLRVVWPILSVLLGLIIALGLVVGLHEGWTVHESISFALVSGLTIGYGDLAPTSLRTRALAILIGACGVLLTALVAAIAVQALAAATDGGQGGGLHLCTHCSRKSVTIRCFGCWPLCRRCL